ncbi:MAG TPA: preprotein translocase subunit SecE [Caulobacteraceae bacterium]|jgi:preprotein translocase subunit SecE|nr:preprotein translocase subunit SecE [Caulobacteraceae bacterium]
MAKDQGVKTPTVQKAKGSARTPATAGVSPSVAAPAPKRRTNPAQFVTEVRAEARKITWTSWKETWITSVMVLIMVVVVSLFLRVVDLGLGLTIQQILKLAS